MSSVFVTQLHVLGPKNVFQFLNHSDDLQRHLQEREARQELNCAQLCRCSTTFFQMYSATSCFKKYAVAINLS